MVACASRILRLNLYQSCLNGERFQPFFVSTIAVFRASFLRRWKHLFYNRTTHFSTFNGHSRIAMTNININIRIIIKCGWLAVFIIISIKLYSNIYSEKKHSHSLNMTNDCIENCCELPLRVTSKCECAVWRCFTPHVLCIYQRVHFCHVAIGHIIYQLF